MPSLIPKNYGFRMDKKKLSERDICSKFINPALEQAGWTAHQIREEVTFTNGQIHGSWEATHSW